MIIKNIQIAGKHRQSRHGMGEASSMEHAAEEKKKMMEMKKKAEGDINLGYMGDYQTMYCKETEQLTDRLKCNYDKWKFDDPLAKNDPRRKAMEKKRKGRHKYSIQSICMNEDPFLCSTKDRDDNEKDKDEICMAVEACREPESLAEDIYTDSKGFFTILLEALDFGKKKDTTKRGKNTKGMRKLKEKLKKELKKIKTDYDALKGKGKGKKRATGGGKKNRGTVGSSGCTGDGAKPDQSFAKDWKLYKQCVLPFKQESSTSKTVAGQSKEHMETMMAKFKLSPMKPNHTTLLEKYHSKKKLLDKLSIGPASKLRKLKDTIKEKSAALSMRADSAKKSFSKTFKEVSTKKQESRKKRLNGNPELKDTIIKSAKLKAETKFKGKFKEQVHHATNKLKQDPGWAKKSKAEQAAAHKEIGDKFKKKETDAISRETQKQIKSTLSGKDGEYKKLKKEARQEGIKKKAQELGIDPNLLRQGKKTGFFKSSDKVAKKTNKALNKALKNKAMLKSGGLGGDSAKKLVAGQMLKSSSSKASNYQKRESKEGKTEALKTLGAKNYKQALKIAKATTKADTKFKNYKESNKYKKKTKNMNTTQQERYDKAKLDSMKNTAEVKVKSTKVGRAGIYLGKGILGAVTAPLAAVATVGSKIVGYKSSDLTKKALRGRLFEGNKQTELRTEKKAISNEIRDTKRADKTNEKVAKEEAKLAASGITKSGLIKNRTTAIKKKEDAKYAMKNETHSLLGIAGRGLGRTAGRVAGVATLGLSKKSRDLIKGRSFETTAQKDFSTASNQLSTSKNAVKNAAARQVADREALQQQLQLQQQPEQEQEQEQQPPQEQEQEPPNKNNNQMLKKQKKSRGSRIKGVLGQGLVHVVGGIGSLLGAS